MTSIVATGIGVVGTAMLDRFRRRSQQQSTRADRERGARRAMRLVEQELFEAETRLTRTAKLGRFTVADQRLDTNAWNAYRGDLAEELGVADWHRLNSAYDAIKDLNERLDERLAPVETKPESISQAITSGAAAAALSRVREDDDLELRWRAIRTASWILRSHLGDVPAGAEEVIRTLHEDERLAGELWPVLPA